jgi:hypothetical protein
VNLGQEGLLHRLHGADAREGNCGYTTKELAALSRAERHSANGERSGVA